MMEEQRHPEVVVGCFITDRSGRLLLVKSSEWGDRYVLPGGHVEYGEKLEDCAVRETKEETNLNVDAVKLLAVFDLYNGDDEFYKKSHLIAFQYLCRTKGENTVKLNDEAQSYIWVTPDEALRINIASYVRKDIDAYNAYNKQVG